MEPLQTQVKKNKHGLGAEKPKQKIVKVPRTEKPNEQVSFWWLMLKDPVHETFCLLSQNYLISGDDTYLYDGPWKRKIAGLLPHAPWFLILKW